MKIHTGDQVVIIAGKDRGKKGQVTRALPAQGRVVVSGANIITRHVKASGRAPGGRVQSEGPIHVSNVKIICPKTEKSSKVGYEVAKDGKKIRIAKVSGAPLKTAFRVSQQASA